MARKCACDGLLAMARNDPRLLAMGRASTWLWVELVLAIREHGFDGVLEFGNRFGSINEIAHLLRIDPTELETQVTQYVRRELLVRRACGALALPPEMMPSARAIAARLNGKKGGRPRKTEPVTGQGTILLPIAGGLDAAASAPIEQPEIVGEETEPQTRPQPPLAGARAASLASSISTKAKLAVSEPEFHRIGRLAFDAAGFDGARNMSGYGIVRQWLADGADEALILDVIERKTRPGLQHLGYFSAAIGEAIEVRGPIVPVRVFSPEETAARAAWSEAATMWGLGPKTSPPPDLQAYLARARAA